MKTVAKVLVLVIVLVIAFFAYKGLSGARELTVLSWDNYIGPNTIADFEKKCDCKVVYELMKSNEEGLAKLKSSPGVYDVGVFSDYMVKVLKDEGMVEKLDKKKLMNVANISDDFKSSYFDPGLDYTVPYAYGSTGFGVNTKYYTGATISWRELSKPQYKGKVAVMDDARYVLGSVLVELGLDPNTRDQKDIDRAVALFKQVVPNIQKFTADTPVDLMVSEGAWVAYGYSGDVFQMHDQNPAIIFMTPEKGSMKFLDNMLIPAGAPHSDLAHQYIDFILDPKVSADITNEIHYGNPNVAARTYIDSKILANPSTFPSSDVLKKLHFVEDVGDDLAKYDKAWEDIKQ
jgi:spermidine/putrescine transport system substrate-binding protein